jgi:hypothetical protein
MASLTGPVYVPAPNPLLPRYGLFQVATGPLDLPINARSGGLQYEISTCTLPKEYEVECQETHNTKVITSGVTVVTGAPFIVYSAIQCDTVGLVNWGQDRVQRFLYDQLVAGEQATVESIFSQGLAGQLPSLQGATNLGTAVGPVQAIAKLESWLYARYGLKGVIHAPVYAAPYLSGSHAIDREGDYGSEEWYTDMRTCVSLGNYANVGPTGSAAAAGEAWIYITGAVAIWRTPDNDLFVPPMGQVINRSTNVLTIVMEREYIVTYDCFAAAVLTTLSTTDR